MNFVDYPSTQHRDDIVQRRLAQDIVTDKRPLTLLSAPRGFGKSTVARQVVTRFDGESYWLNIVDLKNSNRPAELLAAMAALFQSEISMPGHQADGERTVQNTVARLNSRRHPVLLVINGLSDAAMLPFIRALVECSVQIAPMHKIIVTSTLSLNDGVGLLVGSNSCRVVGGADLRLTPEEVSNLLPPSWRTDNHLMGLLAAGDGWPALIGLILSSRQSTGVSTEIEASLLQYINDSLVAFLPEKVWASALLLGQVQTFDESLIFILGNTTTAHINILVNAGLLIQTERLGFEFHYSWPELILRVLQRAIQVTGVNRLDRLRMLAWADRAQRWEDGLYLASTLDTSTSIRRRLIDTGRYIQETGNARLLRETLQQLPMAEDIHGDDAIELLFIDLAAHGMRPVTVLSEKLEQSYQKILTLEPEHQKRYLTWVQCVDAQFAMREFKIKRATELAKDIQPHLALLPEYYRAQALSVLGEVAMLDGELQQSLQYFNQGADIAARHNLVSSSLWHQHQLAQVNTLAGHTSHAENTRFSAIQSGREQRARQLFPYRCLLRAHCESLFSELSIQEAEPFLIELEQQSMLMNDNDALSTNLIRLEFHRLQCLLNLHYQYDIKNTVAAIERALLHLHHPHVVVRAERALLNYWCQSEQVHQLSQWYQRQKPITGNIESPDQLIQLRNLLFAAALLQDFDIHCEALWPEYSSDTIQQWLNCWPGVAPDAVFLLALGRQSGAKADIEKMALAIGRFSLCNNLAEPLAYRAGWLDVLHQPGVTLHRYQTTFVSRLNAIWGNRVKHNIVRDREDQPSGASPLGLSPREWQLLQCVSLGQTNESIAEQLHLNIGTVKNQLTKVYRKLGVSGSNAARSRFKSLGESA